MLSEGTSSDPAEGRRWLRPESGRRPALLSTGTSEGQRGAKRMMGTRWKLLAGGLAMSLGGLAALAGQCTRTDPSKGGGSTASTASTPASPVASSTRISTQADSPATEAPSVPQTKPVANATLNSPAEGQAEPTKPSRIPDPTASSASQPTTPSAPAGNSTVAGAAPGSLPETAVTLPAPAPGSPPLPTLASPAAPTDQPPAEPPHIVVMEPPTVSPSDLPGPAATLPPPRPAASSDPGAVLPALPAVPPPGSIPASAASVPTPPPLPEAPAVPGAVRRPMVPPVAAACPAVPTGVAPTGVAPAAAAVGPLPASVTPAAGDPPPAAIREAAPDLPPPPPPAAVREAAPAPPSPPLPSAGALEKPLLNPEPAPQVAVGRLPARYRVLLRVGEGEPAFEVRCGDDLMLKVVCTKVEVKSPEHDEGPMSVRAVGNVRFVGFGAEGTCEELSFLAGDGSVQLQGRVVVRVKDKLGRVESELSGDTLRYRIDPSAISGILRP